MAAPRRGPIRAAGRQQHRNGRIGALVLVALVLTLLGTGAAPSSAFPTASAATAPKKTATPFYGLGSSHDRLIGAIVSDLDAFWRVELPKSFGVVYTPLAGFRASSQTVLPPACGRVRITFDDVGDNAFYCRTSDYITWDDVGLFPELEKAFGDAALGVVLAHEIGHAIQARAKVSLPDVYMELQADCFAGAWFRHVADDASKSVKFEAGALDDALGAILAFRDDPGTAANAADAHGNGFDRISSFQLGYASGTKRCARYKVDRPPVTATSFRAGEEANGGDVELDEAIDLAARTAKEHFPAVTGTGAFTFQLLDSTDALRGVLRACPDGFGVSGSVSVVCPSSGVVAVDRTRLLQIYGAVRDAGVAYTVVLAWAAAVERRLQPDRTASLPFTLAVHCLAGTWLGAVSSGSDASLSPGDLDEAIAAAIGLPPITVTGPTATVSGFDRVASMRSGFLNGVKACS